MNLEYCAIILISFLHYASAACIFEVDWKGYQCKTIEEVSVAANKAWTKLAVFTTPHLEKNALKKASNLVFLECYYTGTIEEGAFNGLDKLETLRLYNVAVLPIRFDVFDHLPIKELIISQSDIKTIPLGAFNKFSELKRIELSDNQIMEIQKGVYDNTNIEVLFLDTNKINKIAEKAFENMPKLTEITFEDNLLEEFNSELYFGTSNSLKKLWLSDNKFTKVTKDMFTSTPNLISLYLPRNQIETIEPGSFSNLPKIEIMSFDTNNMTVVRKGVFDGTNVQELYLDNNMIEYIEQNAFGNMTELYYMSFEGNRLKYFISECYFGTSSSVIGLWLSNNLLSEINPHIFSAFPDLNELYIELNNISSIEFGSFDVIPKLNTLDLSNNKISSLRPSIFPKSGMQKLISFTVHNNRLTFINKLLLVRLPKLEYITYAGNPLQCPCNVQLTKLITKRNITRICDQDYLEGQRPVCVFSSLENEDCLYDEDLNDELYKVYDEAVEGYPKLDIKCSVGTGYDNAVLERR